MPPLNSNDPIAHEIHVKAQKAAEKNVYTMANPYTTKDEKLEIECWYQLPLNLSGFVFIITCVLWSRSIINWWEAFLVAFIAGIFAALTVWYVYNRKFVMRLEMIFRFPVLWWLIRLGFAGWLIFTGSWIQGACLIANLLLADMPVGFGAMLTNSLLASKYKMHPKYAFLKHFYSKTYPFE